MAATDVKLKDFLAGVVVAMIPVGFHLAQKHRQEAEDRAQMEESTRAMNERYKREIEAIRRIGGADDNKQVPPEARAEEAP